MTQVFDHWEVAVTFLDTGLQTTTKTYELVGTSADHDDVLVNVGALLTDIILVTDLSIVGYSVHEVWANDALSTPAAGIQLENQMILTMPIENNPLKSATIVIPGVKNTMFLTTSGAGNNDANMANTTLQGFLDNFRSAAAVALVSDGEYIDVSGAGGVGKRRHIKKVYG